VSAEAEVRRARHQDWPAVQALLREVDELHARLAPTYFRASERAEAEWQRLLADPAAAAWVALAPAGSAGARPPVGFLSLHVYDTPADPAMVPRRRGHVETLVVAARQRRRGIGRALLQTAAAWARGQGAVEMVLSTWAGNGEADAFYERLGYRVLTRVLHAAL
jgi:ribosomal protein S18 acetylase RimI-like enzyme